MSTLDDITVATLEAYEGQNITEICSTGYTAANVNHCAHFVSHALEITAGLRCGSMSWAHRGTGTSLRVNAIYNDCATRGPWADKPTGTTVCLAFVTLPGNMDRNGDMGSMSSKHIGIYKDGTIWHYSNGDDQVVTHAPVAWHNRFKGVYGASTQMFYAVF